MAGWGCSSCEQFYIPKTRLIKAVLKAYDMLNADDSPKAKEIKEQYPQMENVEYWWLKALVKSISFDNEAKNMTVHWLSGSVSEISTGYYRMKETHLFSISREV